MKLTFVEMPWFTERFQSRLSDDGFRALQNELLADPQKGKTISGCGGLRKMRFADPSRGKGKRGGLRVVYLYTMSEAEKASFFDRIKKGLEDSVAHSKGELTLRTTTLPLPPPAASPRRVAALRRRLGMSQSVFAATLNVSPKLVQSWEQGTRRPGRGDLRLLQILDHQPRIVSEVIAASKTR